MFDKNDRKKAKRFFPWVTLVFSIAIGPLIFLRLCFEYGPPKEVIWQLSTISIISFSLVWIVYVAVNVLVIPFLLNLLKKPKKH